MNTSNLNSFSSLSVSEQRDELQNNNNDLLAWVFNMHQGWEWSRVYDIENIENMLACYPNQLDDGQIKLPEDFDAGSLVIVNMWALRKWKLEIIAWSKSNITIEENIDIPILLSPWVIEYWEDEKSWKKYTETVLRDGWQMNSTNWINSLADANERTTTAWRNFSWMLHSDLEIENAEESPFLMKNKNWEYFLVTHDLEYVDFLRESVKNFLKNKYLKNGDENYEEVKKNFERKFKWVKYNELWNILQEILAYNRFESYQWKDWNIEGVNETLVQLWDEEWKFYVYHDKENNTIEYRAIREITSFPEWLTAVWKIPLRLFLESQNQDPQFRKIENIWLRKTKLVPTINDVSSKVSDAIDSRKQWLNMPREKVADLALESMIWFIEHEWYYDEDEAIKALEETRKHADTVASEIPLSVIHKQKFAVDMPSRRALMEWWSVPNVIYDSDSNVYNFWDYVMKTYFSLSKEKIEKYHEEQNKLSEIDFPEIEYGWELNWKTFQKVKINISHIWNEVYWNDTQSVSFVKKIDSQLNEDDRLSYFNQNMSLFNSITEQISSQMWKDIPNHPMNMHFTWIENWVLQISVTDMCGTVKNYFE